MMSINDYLETVKQSGLVARANLERELDGCLLDHKAQANELGRRLVLAGWLTHWQNDLLQRGLTQGFFLGPYKIMRRIGAGSMSSVFLGEHTILKRQVAIKILHRKLADDPKMLARFRNEACVVAALCHPHLVQAWDYGCVDERHYLVLEYVPGYGLDEVVQRGGRLPFLAVADYVRQAAAGLAEAHAQDIIHRDVKPANLLLALQGQVKVADFGLSQSTPGVCQSFDEGTEMLGTPDYLPPEQAMDCQAVEGRADVYSLGCTLYHLLTGSAPYMSDSFTQILLQHQSGPVPNVLHQRDDIPRELAKLTAWMMSKNWEKRPTMLEVHTWLRRWLKPHTLCGQTHISHLQVLYRLSLNSPTPLHTCPMPELATLQGT